MPNEPLRFKVAPHIVQDLGLNLYTELPRVLVEFIANAYDADSPTAMVVFDKVRIDMERRAMKAQWQADKERAEADGTTIDRLEERSLPEELAVTVEDRGCGMTRQELQDKFLVAGRRRRGAKNDGTHTDGGRVIMGRKGLGKLAGFGIAKVVRLTSRAKGESHATRITLRYDALIQAQDTNEIPIDEEVIDDGDGLEPHGTRVELTSLLHEPMGSRITTIENRVGDHFAQIDPDDFRIELNGTYVEPTPRTFAYAWPNPETDAEEMVDQTLPAPDGRELSFSYRLRFVEDRAALAARSRGIRVYAHKRLASAPSLLDADTNMHGFRMTDYLDGVVYADFIDDEPEDYIATDRQSLRWESPLLAPLNEFLSAEIKEACKQRQAVRDAEKKEQATTDPFTTKTIEEANLTKREATAARRIATAISSLHKKGYQDQGYQKQFGEVVGALGRGELFATLAQLAKEDDPEIERVLAEVTKLNAEEMDGYFKYVRGRLDGIEALRRIVEGVDFRAKKNEKELHKLLMECPWLIDPAYFQYVTSDKSEKTFFLELENALEINASLPNKYDPTKSGETDAGGSNKRPDLAFALGTAATSNIVIVELKAPNTPLHGEHYRQLQGYIRSTKKFLKKRESNATVEGLLIGSFEPIESRAEEVAWLEDEIEKSRNQGECRVFSISKLLENAQDVHRAILDVAKASS